MRRLLPIVLALVVLLGGGLAWQLLRPEPGPRWNVLLVSIDSLRADHLGAYGYQARFVPEELVSPRLDALATEGVLFENAWSTTSWTLPAHMALLTGLTDDAHGVEQDDFALDPHRRTLAEEFRDAGYRTGGYYGGPYLDPRHGFGRGFEDYRSAMASPEAIAGLVRQEEERCRARGAPPMNAAELRIFRDRLSHRDITSGRVNALAREFLERDDDRPFFLFLHYFDVHYDYIPDAAEAGLGRRFDPDYQGQMDGANWYFNPAVRDPKTGARRISDRDLQHVEALYDAEIHWVDRHVGAVLDMLRQRGLLENTVVCVTSDHGDEFFEHGSIGHRSTLYPELLHIPLILRLPGAAGGGLRVPELVRIYDLAPTLLDLCGMDGLPEAAGRSLRPLLEGRPEPPRTLLCRIVGGPVFRDGWRSDRYAVLRLLELDLPRTRAVGKLVLKPATRADGRPLLEIRDRRQDPGETGPPLAPEDPRWQEALQAFCRDFRSSQAHALALSRSPRAARYAPRRSAEEEATLAALGYADGAEVPSAGDSPRFPPVAAFPAPCPLE